MQEKNLKNVSFSSKTGTFLNSEVKKQIGDRLRKFRENKGLKIKKIAEVGGVSYTFIYQVEKGKKQPPLKLLISLAKDHKLNLNWLLTGEGEMLVKSANEVLKERIGRAVNDSKLPYLAHNPRRQQEIQELVKNIRKRLEKDIQALNRLLGEEEEEENEEEKLDKGEK